MFPTPERVVNRWPFPRALLDLLSPSGDGDWVCKGLLARARHGVGSTNGPALVTFASPSETLSGVRCPLILSVGVCRPCGKRLPFVLDLGSSHGVVIDLPLHRYRRLVSTPSGPAAPKSCRGADLRGDLPSDAEPPLARSCHLPDSFRPCRSSRLRRFAPPGTSQVCCTLKPIMGFAKLRVFGACWLHLVPTCRSRSYGSSPPRRRYPEGRPVQTLPRFIPALFRRRAVGIHLDEAGRRHPPTVPVGAPPFEAFPSLSAVTRQPQFVSALRLPPPYSGNPSALVTPFVLLGHEAAGHREACLLAVGPE